MFPTWRLRIREARLAFEQGRWEEASALLAKESVRDFLPAKKLSHEVASRLVVRAQDRLESGDSVRGWYDLQQAIRLGGCDRQVAKLRAIQTERGLERVRQLLISGETTLAGEQIAKLEQRQLGGDQRRKWKLIVHWISQARKLSAKGEMTVAVDKLQRAMNLLPDPNDEISGVIAARQAQLEHNAGEIRRLSESLHRALAEQSWTEVLTTAGALLELAPDHTAARQARRRAWQAVGMKVTLAYPGPPPLLPKAERNGRLRSTRVWTTSAKVNTMTRERQPGKRMLVWIDGVGGYLVCLGDEVMLGQPAGSSGAEIPILADLSRRHATIHREGGSYVLTPIHQVRMAGQQLAGPTVLTDDTLIELGEAVRLRFRKPHALSATAVLELESHHKTDPAVDRILLMSESCIFGSRPHSHVFCRHWPEDLVLFRRGDDLHFRTSTEVQLDGAPVRSGGIITGNSRLESDYFAMSFEEI
ncbi:MAG: hypothetical protein MI725_01255 [Pirellulales bacterium]|nr:hypothetical protein [Pirellulales bacterium]